MLKVVLHDYRGRALRVEFHDGLGVGNQNSGIVHLGKSGSGSESCCGNQRAYQSLGRTEFNNSPSRCKRCESIAQRKDVERPRAAPAVRVHREPELPPWGSKPAREMSTAEIRSWLSKKPRKDWREILESVLSMKLMRGEK